MVRRDSAPKVNEFFGTLLSAAVNWSFEHRTAGRPTASNGVFSIKRGGGTTYDYDSNHDVP